MTLTWSKQSCFTKFCQEHMTDLRNTCKEIKSISLKCSNQTSNAIIDNNATLTDPISNMANSFDKYFCTSALDI